MKPPLHSRARAMLLSLGFAAACADEPRWASGLEVRVSTNLATSDIQFIAAESLDGQGMFTVQSGWFQVDESCIAAADGSRLLGSFGVERAARPISSLRLTAYRREADGTLTPVVSQRLDATFGEGVVPLGIQLAKSCKDVLACPDGQTCDPSTGLCQAIASIGSAPLPPPRSEEACLLKLGSTPPGVIVSPAETSRVNCFAGDGQCPSGCDWTRDSDCRIAAGDPCDLTKPPPCVDGAVCVHGVCCQSACSGECERCDLPISPGICSHFLYASREAPRSAPDFAAACASDHVAIACSAGTCSAECDKGYKSCDGISMQENGCETQLGTVSNCLDCRDACKYGYCGPQGCTFHPIPEQFETERTTVLEAGHIYSTPIAVAIGDTKLRALGALVDPTLAGRVLRLALYVRRGSIWERLASTTDLHTVDSSSSAVAAPPNAVRVEGHFEVTRLPLGGSYQISVQVSDATKFVAGERTKSWLVAPQSYGEFPAELFVDIPLQKLPSIQLYLVTTPE